MALIVDTSLAGTWLMPDEERAFSLTIGQRVVDEGASVPDLFWHEIRNLVMMGVQRKRISESQFWHQLARPEDMPLRTAPPRPSEPVAMLALKHRLTSYDAAYLDLALTPKLPLATLDRKLRTATRSENVSLLPQELG